MASALKRKGGPMEDAGAFKRSKSTQEDTATLPIFEQANSGWEAAFGGLKGQIATNGVNGAHDDVSAVDFEDFVVSGKHKKKSAKAGSKHSKLKEVARSEKQTKHTPKQPRKWQISHAIGGRILDLDPVFVDEERYIIVAQRTSLHVYSTATSLLHRTIDFKPVLKSNLATYIVSFAPSPKDPNIIWVAFSNGFINRIDWTTGKGTDQGWKISPRGIISLAVAKINSAERERDVIFTTAATSEETWQIVAHEISALGASLAVDSKVIYTTKSPISDLRTANDGKILLATAENRILLGRLKSVDFQSADSMRYEFFVFESTDHISSLDIRVSDESTTSEKKKPKSDKVASIDVVVGDVKGAIFVHQDLLRNLIKAQKRKADGKDPLNLVPRKLHWHRKAVSAVKWSRDGNYIISGGSETVLVFWQLDTGRQQFLPHLSATIRNIVISPRGSSYAINLGDNSSMVLSTAELKPTTHIAGIQANVVRTTPAPDSHVQRVSGETHKDVLVQKVPAIVNPALPSQLLLAVGEQQEFESASQTVLSTPYLQTFDISSNQNVSRQALTRTNVTNVNIAPTSYPITDPRITQMEISSDGRWLATIDEWQPSEGDPRLLPVQSGHKDRLRNRAEVFLKFWQWNEGDGDKSWELISRIDSPHSLSSEVYGVGKVLALAANPSTATFSTLGEDDILRIWGPRTRTRDNVVVRGQNGQPLINWVCQRSINLGHTGSEGVSFPEFGLQNPKHGCIAYSQDGSILAVATSSNKDKVIHLVDPITGTIRSSRPVMYDGDLVRMAILDNYLVVLARDFRIYDVVLDELQYGIELNDIKYNLSLEQKLEMIHLAVDKASKTVAVAIPCLQESTLKDDRGKPTLSGAYSELAVFSPTQSQPLLTEVLPHLVTALIPTVGTPGYVILDTAAQVLTVSPIITQKVISTAKPLVDLGLENGVEEPTTDLVQLGEDDEELDDDIDSGLPQVPVNDEDDDETPVVTQDRLARVFDIGPSFAMPPIEQLFYEVADLFSSKSRVQKV